MVFTKTLNIKTVFNIDNSQKCFLSRDHVTKTFLFSINLCESVWPIYIKNVLQKQFIHKTEHSGHSLRLLLCAASRDTVLSVYCLLLFQSTHSFSLVTFNSGTSSQLGWHSFFCCGAVASVAAPANTLREIHSQKPMKMFKEVLMKPNVMEMICFQYFTYSQSESIWINPSYISHLDDHKKWVALQQWVFILHEAWCFRGEITKAVRSEPQGPPLNAWDLHCTEKHTL